MFTCYGTERSQGADAEEVIVPEDAWKQLAAEDESLRKAEDGARRQTEELRRQVKEAERAYREEHARYERLRREREMAEHAEAAQRSEASGLAEERERWLRKTAVAAFLKDHGFSSVVGSKRSLVPPMKTTHPLHVAAERGQVRMVDMLLKEGANVQQKNSSGKTALQVAQEKDLDGSHEGVLRVLGEAVALAGGDAKGAWRAASLEATAVANANMRVGGA